MGVEAGGESGRLPVAERLRALLGRRAREIGRASCRERVSYSV